MKHAMFVLLLSVCSLAQQPTKAILISVHAENEGPGGPWIQSEKDLSAAELAKLQELLDSSFSTIKDVRLVEMQDKRDHIEIVVSVTKVPRGESRWYYAASSVIGIARPEIDEFVSHNVIVGEDIATLAKTIGFSFLSTRLRVELQLLSP